MRRLALMTALACGCLLAADDAQPATFWQRFRAVVDSHLGRPYVWGATGNKSFDCSGFVWRVLNDNGIFLKRTTARKLYVALPAAPQADRWKLGNIVFFDQLKHCGIVDGPAAFYHAETTSGTRKAVLGPFWRAKVCGVRRVVGMPVDPPQPRGLKPAAAR